MKFILEKVLNLRCKALTLLQLGTNSCKAFILSAILSRRNCTKKIYTYIHITYVRHMIIYRINKQV